MVVAVEHVIVTGVSVAENETITIGHQKAGESQAREDDDEEEDEENPGEGEDEGEDRSEDGRRIRRRRTRRS